MMNTYFMIAILLVNILGVVIVYQFIKKIEKKEKVVFIAISVALMYILISIVYWFSGFGVNKNIHEASKDFVLYMFVPVNVILFIPYFASQYMKLKSGKIKIEKFINKLSTLIVLLIVVLVVEYFYFRNIQLNIKYMQHNTIVNEIENINNNEMIITNEVNNQILTNEMLIENV